MSNDIRNEGLWEEINIKREFMKCPDFKVYMGSSDQQKELSQPPLSAVATTSDIIELPVDFDDVVTNSQYCDLLDIRRSERIYNKNVAMSQSQLSFILWSTQGVQEIKGENYCTLRPAPSGGARHPFETYILVRNVDGLNPGLYHYLPLEHIGEKRVAIEFVGEFDDYKSRVTSMLADQKWARNASVIVFYTCVAYRAEWRYSHMAHRVALIDLGHVGQNLMLSAAAIGLGSCCMAAFDQKLCDEALNLDGYEEFTVYACSVGETR